MTRIFDAEASVLGGCVCVADAYWRVADLLGPDDFSSDQNRALWRTLADMAQSGTPVDVFTVGERNPHVARLALEYAGSSPSVANIRAYAESVQRHAILRRVRSAGQRIGQLAGDDALGEAQRILAACAPRMASAIRPAREFLRRSVEQLQARCDATEVLTGVPTSLDWLDEVTSGLQRDDLILVGARPSVGKTALAVQVSAHAAQVGHPVLFLSLEMGGSQLTDRLLSHLSGVNGQHIRQPKKMDEADWPKITAAGAKINAMPLLIDETAALTLEQVCARIRQANAMQRMGLVAIDYLTCIVPPKAEKLTDGIQIITRTLKALAKELHVPILLLSQLNRAGDSKPSLTSLRESGAIEQDADLVILLHRPREEQRHLIECIVAKQRNGPTGETFLHFDGATQRFRVTQERPQVDAPKRRGFNTFAERAA